MHAGHLLPFLVNHRVDRDLQIGCPQLAVAHVAKFPDDPGDDFRRRLGDRYVERGRRLEAGGG